MKARVWVAFAVGLVGLVAPTPATADPVLAANCQGPSTGQIGSGPDGRRAQTFIPQTTGTLVRGEAEIDKAGGTADFVMQIAATDGAGNPTNTVLASTTIPNASVPTGITNLVGVFDAPASVEAGQQYALVVTRPPGSFSWRERSDNPCPGGEFSSPSQTGAWSPDLPNVDSMFAVFVEPPPEPLPKVPRTLTLDANKNKVKKGKRVTLTGQINEVVRQGPCESNQTVDLQRKRPSQTTFTTAEQLQTDAAGAFSAKEKVKKTFEYRAVVPETATCAGQTSNTEKVKVKKRR
jgi:hypothetical protein